MCGTFADIAERDETAFRQRRRLEERIGVLDRKGAFDAAAAQHLGHGIGGAALVSRVSTSTSAEAPKIRFSSETAW